MSQYNHFIIMSFNDLFVMFPEQNVLHHFLPILIVDLPFNPHHLCRNFRFNVSFDPKPGLPLQARLERMAEFQQRGEDLENNLVKCKRQLEEARARLRDLKGGEKEGEKEEGGEEEEAELRKAQADVTRLGKDEKMFEKMIEEHRREERKLPWNVDTISKDGFSKVRPGWHQGHVHCNVDISA